ncbi:MULTISPECIES: hypothetical protein [Sporosarcina]|uniref:hypothetical protein n=1 Tax=Sporosarcina TaxID=1569 RepID=UPI000A17E154|nr:MULTISPECIES: hypothetical protein [Sporosarcina]ARK22282.1 hypothetical protein SporoP32a_12545 [Sporosarcina ureae]PIC74208.1 hypothetical protein CSV76_06875 [Sporosarcina sp. P17b]
MKKDNRFLCYPFMRESVSTVDFEIRTDSLTTRIGEAIAVNPVQRVCDDLHYLQPMAYHLNGSVRGKTAIFSEDVEKLSEMYDFYTDETQSLIDRFVLPQGTHAACVLHVCRSEAKKSVRALHKVSLEREVPDILFDYTHLLANVLFVMAVYTNKVCGVEEIQFVSKSYPIRKKKKVVDN